MLSASAIEARYKRAKLNVKNTFLWPELNNDHTGTGYMLLPDRTAGSVVAAIKKGKSHRKNQ